MRGPVLLSFVAAFVSAATVQKRAPPTATIINGTFTGESTWWGVDNWMGIPYAEPPVGSLRLKRPIPLTRTFSSFSAVGTPRACTPLESTEKVEPNAFTALLGLGAGPTEDPDKANFGEDCLTINVQRPTGTSPDAKLPVVLWFFGGGFESGSTQTYDGTNLITASVRMKKPVIFAAANYRNGAFGFLGGRELMAEGNTNLGLRDQRLAMQWVQDNIAAFGGDPEKVTLWGESAGSISIMNHQIINGGDITYNGKPMFRGAIMNSGTITPTVPVDSPKAQDVYDQVVREAGCTSSDNTLACLRAAPYDKLRAAANSLPGLFSYRSVDLAYLPRPDPTDDFFPESPEKTIINGTYAHIPIITGNQDDEGTLFAINQRNITTNKELDDYFATFFPNGSYDTITGMTKTYSEKPSLGSPWGTGDSYAIYPQFKRLAAILGDSVFTLKRRVYLDAVTEHPDMPAWSYLCTFLKDTPYLGTFHGSDVYETFIGTPNAIGDSILSYYVSFINELNPNTLTRAIGGRMVEWPRWTRNEPLLMNFRSSDNGIITDDFRNESYQYLKEHISNFQT